MSTCGASPARSVCRPAPAGSSRPVPLPAPPHPGRKDHVYPLSLDLRGRRTLVVGGGPVAARRAVALVEAGAVVDVVAPYICEDLRDLVNGRRVTWFAREYDGSDLPGAWLVQACPDNAETNAAVAADADAMGIWCVRADDAAA